MKPRNLFHRILTGPAFALAVLIMPAAPANAQSTRYWDGGTTDIGTNGDGVSQGGAGGGTWNTTTVNWDQGNGLAHVAWNNSNNDTAVFAGTAGTVTLAESITLGNITFDAGAYTLSGGTNTLAFGAGGTISNNAGSANQTIVPAITGSPSVLITSVGGSYATGITFAPTNGTVTLGTCTVPFAGASGDKSTLTLGGATTGNSISIITKGTSMNWGAVTKSGASTWSVGNVDVGSVYMTSGNLIATGTIRTYDQGLYLSGGVFHYNNAGAVTNHQGFRFSSGTPSLDNSSGAAITTSTTNPPSTWSTSWTFVGSNGANSDLNIGTGQVTLLAAPTVTVSNASTTLTIGGVITDGSATYGLTKAGPGTLKLTGINTYQGATTVNAGTLVITQPSPSANGPMYLASGAKLDLSFAGTKSVFALVLNGSLAATGTWGATGSGAANIDDTYFSGTGIINNLGGLVAANTWYWDGANTGGTGDGLSAGGSGTWSTTQTNWDQGLVSRKAWPNTTADSAFFNTVAGTVTLGSPITLGSLDLRGVDYTIGGASETNTLNFGGANTITVYQQSATFNSGISGNPTVNLDGTGTRTWTLQPTASVSMNLGAVNVSGSSDAHLKLGGASAGNSVGDMIWSTTAGWTRIYKQGTGTWTVNGAINAAGGNVLVSEISAGTLIISTSGSMRMTQGFTLNGGALHLNNPGAYRGSTMVITSGSLDNSSGAPITTSTWNPAMSWNGNFTFLGSNGANSDLNLGTGAVSMNASRTVTVNSTATLTVGGVVSGATFGLTKSGTGTLKLSGNSTYNGATTVSAGTLAVTGSLGATAVSVNAGTLAGNGNIGGSVTIASGARHALAVAATTGAQVTRAITGTLTLTAGNILDLTAAATPADGVYVLATATTAITGTPTTINYNGINGTVSVDTASSPQRLLLTVSNSPYDAWANGTYSPALTAKLSGDNQDGDSLTNLQEFAFGTQPTVSTGEIAYSAGTLTTPGAPKVVAASGNYSMVFGRRADYVAAGLTYTVQFSTALEAWVDNDDVANAPVQVATDGTINAMSVPYPNTINTPNGPRKPTFSRVKVVLAP